MSADSPRRPDSIHVSYDKSETVFIADLESIVFNPPDEANVQLPDGVCFVKIDVRTNESA